MNMIQRLFLMPTTESDKLNCIKRPRGRREYSTKLKIKERNIKLRVHRRVDEIICPLSKKKEVSRKQG